MKLNLICSINEQLTIVNQMLMSEYLSNFINKY